VSSKPGAGHWALNNARIKKRLAMHLYENRTLRTAACIHLNTESELQSARAIGAPACNLCIGFSRGAAIRISPDVEGISEGLSQFFGMSELERLEMGKTGRALVQNSLVGGRSRSRCGRFMSG
jgi:hypothetical protein